MKFRKSLITAAALSLLVPAATVLVYSANAGVYSQDEKKKPTRNRQEDRRNDRRGRGGAEDDNENQNMRFAGMDRNRDGQISRSEWRGNDVSFAQHDWNGDGVLSGDEVRPGGQPTNGTNAMFRALDLNRDNRISLDEWQGDDERFELLDRNDDGFLSLSEFRR